MRPAEQLPRAPGNSREFPEIVRNSRKFPGNRGSGPFRTFQPLYPSGLQGCMSFVPNAKGAVSIQVPSEPSGSATQVQISIDPITAGSAPEQPGRTVLVSA